jgi:hypothetical protein
MEEEGAALAALALHKVRIIFRSSKQSGNISISASLQLALKVIDSFQTRIQAPLSRDILAKID